MSGRSDDERVTIERFLRRARAAEGGLAARVLALGDEGLVNLVSRERGWELALAALGAIAERDPLLARAAALNLVAADLVYRWARCDNLRVLEPIVRGRGIAALAGPGDGPEAPRLIIEAGETILTGRCDEVPLLPLADTVIVAAASGPGIAVLALARGEPGLVIQPAGPGPDELPSAALILSHIPIARRHLVGPNPLPASEPGELATRLREARAAWI